MDRCAGNCAKSPIRACFGGIGVRGHTSASRQTDLRFSRFTPWNVFTNIEDVQTDKKSQQVVQPNVCGLEENDLLSR